MTYAEKRIVIEEKRAEMLILLQKCPKSTRDFFKWVPKAAEGIYLRCHTGKVPVKERVKLKCLDCCCWEKVQIAECDITHCALHVIRPYQKK